ncbi:ATP-binding cassette domain-containing protein [Micromonospora sp. NPDC005324]|uniref:ATP-binding cassette domain-containing protein n=1 Tax=Micromonospora sp. NPDC005324 TaxID=3157033 RepID=UPI0033A41108
MKIIHRIDPEPVPSRRSVADVERALSFGLTARGLRHEYQRSTVLDLDIFSVAPGDRHAVIGPTGAGKSTLLNLLAGTTRARSGTIIYNGQTITRRGGTWRARNGIRRTAEHASVYPGLSVLDCVRMGGWHHRYQPERTPLELLNLVGLIEYADHPAAVLPHGRRRMLDLAVALAGQPRVLLLDAPAAGLTDTDTARLLDVLGALPRRMAVVLVEQHLSVVAALADWITVLHQGRRHTDGPADTVRADPTVAALYPGAGGEEASIAPTTAPRRRGVAAAGGTVMALALAFPGVLVPAKPDVSALMGVEAGCAVPDPAPSAELAATAAMPPATVLAYPRAAPGVLQNLAQRIAPEICDGVSGRFDVVRLRSWHLDEGEPATRDVVRWYHDDKSGAALTSDFPDPWPGVMHDFWLPGDLTLLTVSGAFTTSDFFHYSVNVLAGHGGGDRIIHGLARLAAWRSPGPAGRRLAVTELAHTPGLTAYPALVDRAGRTGIGVAAMSANGTERALLILQPSTGQVLAYERATHTPLGWQLSDYWLLLTRTHAERRWWEEPSTTADDTTPVRQTGLMTPRRQSRYIARPDQPCTLAPITATEERTVR